MGGDYYDGDGAELEDSYDGAKSEDFYDGAGSEDYYDGGTNAQFQTPTKVTLNKHFEGSCELLSKHCDVMTISANYLSPVHFSYMYCPSPVHSSQL